MYILIETGTVLLSLFCVALCILTAVTLIIVFVVVMQRRKNSVYYIEFIPCTCMILFCRPSNYQQ